MTQIEFQKLDELRKKDEDLFELTVELLLSLGHENFTVEMITELLGSVNAEIDTKTASLENMGDAIVKVVVLCVVAELRSVSLGTLLDYITENGWRSRGKQ